jgi:ATP/maltotriose-dependent transcriptional regulator MalT
LNREQQLIAEADELVREKQWHHRAFALSVIFTKAKIEGDETKAVLSFQLMEREIAKIRTDVLSDVEKDEKESMKMTAGYGRKSNNNKSREQKRGQQKQRQYHHPQTGESIEALLIQEKKGGGREGEGRETQKSEIENRRTKQPKFMERLQLALFLTDLLTRIEKEEEKEGGRIVKN